MKVKRAGEKEEMQEKERKEKLAGNTAMSRSANREKISLFESLNGLKKEDRRSFCVLTL